MCFYPDRDVETKETYSALRLSESHIVVQRSSSALTSFCVTGTNVELGYSRMIRVEPRLFPQLGTNNTAS